MSSHRTRGARWAGAAALLAASWPSAALAQGVGAGALVQSYTFEEAAAIGLSDFRLLVAPFAASIPLGSRLSVQAAGAFAEGRATGPDGARAQLSGPTDTEVGIALTLGPDAVVFTAAASLPTGASSHSLEESIVAGVVAAELLPFAVTSWGGGGGVGGDLAFAAQAGRWGIGVAGGYRAAREYEPLSEESFAYRPGDQVRVRLALDRDVGESGTFSVLVGLQRFSEDQLGGANLFRSGNRVEGVISYAFALGMRSSALLYGGAHHRAGGALLVEESELAGATASPSQQLFTGGLEMRVPLGGHVTFLPELSGRLFRTADGTGQGWLASAGGSLDLLLAGRRSRGRLVLSPHGRVRLGHVLAGEDAESDVTGWEAGIVLRVERGR